ncbi:MAG: hypothetical protein BroJett029_24850 [Alphaproteobacteria bacterium]|nr:MAG: hypothetical protein BroJett029_24850 [Alphaproteobacteria bacterium]
MSLEGAANASMGLIPEAAAVGLAQIRPVRPTSLPCGAGRPVSTDSYVGREGSSSYQIWF